MGLLDRVRRVYYFAYGAERDPDLLQVVIGARPKVVGPAVVRGYELRVQTMQDAMKPLVRKVLHAAWGESFQSYVLVPKKDSLVHGMLYSLSLARRHKIDEWELVNEGWYEKQFVKAVFGAGREVDAETQILSSHRQSAQKVVDGTNYDTWLLPKDVFMAKAKAIQKKIRRKQSLYNKNVYYFGYGALSDPDMVKAVIGARPRVVGKGTVKDYELRTQAVDEIANEAVQEKLLYAWGRAFKGYTITPKAGAEVQGTLYRIALHRKHMIDKWTLVHEGWHDRSLVSVDLGLGKIINAQTQVLAPTERISGPVTKATSGWLLPKKDLIRKAQQLRVILH